MNLLKGTKLKQKLVETRTLNITLLILVIVIGALLRFYKLSYESFGNDEASSILDAKGRLYNISNPPLSYVILRIFIETLGTNEFTARLPSCLFGIITIPLVYFFRKQLFSEKEGLIASFIISLSPWYTRWSQETRMYTELTVFTLLALYFFYQAIYKETITAYLLSSIFTILAFYTHYSAILIIGIIAVWLVSKSLFGNEKSSINYKQLVLFFVCFIVLSLPLYFITLPQTLKFKTGGSTLRWGMPLLAYFLKLFEDNFGPILSVLSIFGAVFLILKRNSAGYLLTVYAVVPVVTFAALTFIISVDTRYVLFTLPAYSVLTSVLAIEIFNKIMKSEREKEFYFILLKNLDLNTFLAYGFLFTIVISVNNLPAFYYYYSKNNPDWKSACASVASMMKPEDLIATTGDKAVYYYLGKVDFNLSIELFEPGVFDKIRNSHERVWLLILGEMKTIDPDNEFKNWITSHCELITDANGVKVYLFIPSNK